MTFSDKAYQAMRKSGPIACIGCSCEVSFTAISYDKQTLEIVGYDCECGAIVRDGLFMGSSAMS
jgi:hypothetical protein